MDPGSVFDLEAALLEELASAVFHLAVGRLFRVGLDDAGLLGHLLPVGVARAKVAAVVDGGAVALADPSEDHVYNLL